MSYFEERNQMIEKAAQDAANIDGYKVFKTTSLNYHYFFVITPSDNILYIQLDEFFGMCASFEYQPGPNTGRGCGCGCGKGSERLRFYEITRELLEELEKDGLYYARRLKANLYKNSDEWRAGYWDFKNLEEVKPGKEK